MSATITVADDPIARAREAAMPNAAEVAKYREYVLGIQPVTLSAEMQADLTGILGNGYVDNLSRLAVQTAADFLTLLRIDIDAANTPERVALATFIDQTWGLNQMPELSGDVHFAAPRDGNYAIGLSWDARTGRVRFTLEDWWNGQQGMFVHYDSGGLMDYAVKEWSEYDPEATTTIGRRVVYYPDRMERFARTEGMGAWEPYLLPEDGGMWPFPWVNSRGEPVGIPVVHYPNLLIPNHQPGRSARETSRRYGLSLLAGGPLGVQDAVNETQYDLIAAARRIGFPFLWATGVTLPLDPVTKQPIPLVAKLGMVLTNPSEKAAFGMLNPGDLGQLLLQLVNHHRTFARMTNTPMQIVAETDKDAASGVALFRMMMAAVRQARRAQKVYGSRWGMLFHKAVQIFNAFGGGELNPDLMLVGVFEPNEASDPIIMAEMAKTLTEAGYPFSEVLRLVGKTDDEIKRIMDEKDKERKAAAPPPPVVPPVAPPAPPAGDGAATAAGQG